MKTSMGDAGYKTLTALWRT